MDHGLVQITSVDGLAVSLFEGWAGETRCVVGVVDVMGRHCLSFEYIRLRNRNSSPDRVHRPWSQASVPAAQDKRGVIKEGHDRRDRCRHIGHGRSVQYLGDDPVFLVIDDVMAEQDLPGSAGCVELDR